MKNISKLILGMVFGITFISNASVVETPKEITKAVKVDCHTVYTVCDNHAPDNYEHFASCMGSNGC